jgi:hypothetical protein
MTPKIKPIVLTSKRKQRDIVDDEARASEDDAEHALPHAPEQAQRKQQTPRPKHPNIRNRLPGPTGLNIQSN